MSGMTLKFCLSPTSVNRLISEALCDTLYFFIGAGAVGQLHPLHAIVGFHCNSLLECAAVYSGSSVLIFHRNLVPSKSPFSETLLHFKQNTWYQIPVDGD
jgi:hypothetical protein